MRVIAGRFRGRRLQTAKGRAVRPTTDRVRESWLGAIGERVVGSRVLDLFAGSGALGLEALSRGAERVVFVEKARGALGALNANIEALDVADDVQVVRGDALRYARTVEPGAFDVVLADPPYDQGHAAELVSLFLARPFASEFWVEHRSNEPMPAAPDAVTRRYGDTTLTALWWDDDSD